MKRYIILILPIILLSKTVSINSYGAIPNDNKDDTQAIKKALSVSNHITMKQGIYNVHGIEKLNSITVIDGNNSTFKSELETIHNGRTSKNILTLQGDKIEIKKLTLDGTYTNGNSKEANNVSSLLHIYDSNSVILDNISTINYASNWWGKNQNIHNNHQIDMYHVIYIGYSNNIKITNMKQKGNISTEGILIYESDNIDIDGFDSHNSPKIWTSLHIVASDNITMNNIVVEDGKPNDGGSSINFIADHHFLVKNLKATTKQGFDISNEIDIANRKGRVVRDTSDGIFENCYFGGQRPLCAYPALSKNSNIIFKNSSFISTSEFLPNKNRAWNVRFMRAGDISFENCSFGNKKFKTYGAIFGDSDKIKFDNCSFVNPSIGVYIISKHIKELNMNNNKFYGSSYIPIKLSWNNAKNRGKLDKLILKNNKFNGDIEYNNFDIIHKIVDIKK